MAFEMKHLFGLKGVPQGVIKEILDTADSFREVLDRPIRIVPSQKVSGAGVCRAVSSTCFQRSDPDLLKRTVSLN